MEGAHSRQKSLARAGLAETRDHLDALVQEGVHEELLLEIARPNRDSAGGLHEFREFEPPDRPLPVVAGGHGLALVGTQEHILIDAQVAGVIPAQAEVTLRAEPLQFIDGEGDLPVARLLDEFRHLVVEVVLGLEAHGARLQLDVHVLGDEDRRRGELLLHEDGGRDDPVVLLCHVRQHCPQPIEGRRPAARLGQIGVDDHRQGSAVGKVDALLHGPAVGQELLEDAVDAAGVAAPLGRLLPLDRVELLQHLHWYGEVVLLELEYRLRIVKQKVRVEHEGLNFCRNLDPRIWG